MNPSLHDGPHLCCPISSAGTKIMNPNGRAKPGKTSSCLAALLLGLAGCLASFHSTAPSARSMQPQACGHPDGLACTFPVGHFEMNQCQAYYTHVEVDANRMKALLPPGYSPDPPFNGSIETAYLNVYACKSLVLGNRTVIHDFRLAQFQGPAQVPKDVKSRNPNRPDMYELELVVNNQTAAQAFTLNGFHARLGSVEAQVVGQTVQYHITVAGQEQYDLQATGEVDPSSPDLVSKARWHQGDGVHHFVANETENDAAITSAGTVGALTARGGAVQAIGWTALGSTPVQTTIAASRVILDFS
jgi:hypothetical protein